MTAPVKHSPAARLGKPSKRRTFMKPQFVLFLTLSLLCLGTGAALAKTPDGQTPALETVCDMETGAAYGLCNAYCEAMDCETDDPSASATACSKVGNKYRQLTGHDLPCEVSCPCADPSISIAFSDALDGDLTITSCQNIFGGTQVNNFDVRAINFIAGPECGLTNGGSSLPISLEQLQVCSTLLQQAAADQGVTCN
jgi:hypothetical protein